MSFEGIFTGKTTTKKALPTVQSKSSFSGIFSKQEAIPQVTKSQEFVGPLPKAPTKEEKEFVGPLPKNGILTKSLPEHLGGGEYKVDPLNIGKPVKSIRAYADLPTKEKEERDHIISVALGGTSDKNNLQYLATTDEGRQEGKVSVEQEAINSYIRGDISLPQARAKIAQKQQQIKGLSPTPEEQTVRGQFIPGVKQVFTDIGSKFKGLFSKEKSPLPKKKEPETNKKEIKFTPIDLGIENKQEVSGTTIAIIEPKKKEYENILVGEFNDAVKEDFFNDLDKKTQLRSFSEKVKESYTRGDTQAKNDILMWDVITGKKDYEEAKKEKNTLDEISKNDPIESVNLLEKIMFSVSAMLPAMLKGSLQGKVAGGVLGAGAFVLGKFGPLAGLPEEVVTVPTAFKTGEMLGGMEYWYKQGAGSMYSELREEGVDHDTSKLLGSIAGVPYSAIEFSQVDKIIPGIEKAGKNKVKNVLNDGVAKMVAKHGKNWASEVTEEGMQEFIIGMNTEVGKWMDEKVQGLPVAEALWAVSKRSLQTMVDSALPMLLLMSPGASVDIATSKNAITETELVGPQAPKLKMDEAMPELPELPEKKTDKTVLSNKLKKLQGQFIDGGIMDEDGNFQEEEYDEELETEIIKELEDKGFDYEVGDLDNYIFVKIADKNISKVEASKKYKDLLEEVHGKDKTKLETDKEGNIIAYHGTTAKNAKKIMSGEFDSGDFSPSPDTEFLGVGGAGIYGDKLIKVKLDPRKIEMRTVGEIKANNDAIISKEIYKEEEDFREVEVNKQKIKITKQDLYEMADFTDFVNGTLKLDEDKVKILQSTADKIAEKYGFEQTASDRVLANQFGKALDQVDDEFVRKPKEKFKLEEKTLENKKYTKALKYLERANPSNKISETRGFLSPNGNIIDLGAFGQHPLALAEAGLSGKDVDSFTEFGVIRLRNTGEGGQQNIQISQKPTAKQIEQLELLSTKIPIYFDLKNGEETLSSPESGVRRDDFIRIVKDFFGAKQKQTEASLDKQVKEITVEEAKKQLAKIFNNNEVEFLAMKKLPNRVEGRYVQAMIQVLENDGKVKDLVVYHEAFHAYMDIFPSSAEKAKIFDIVKNNFKDEVSAKKELYKQGGVNLNDSDASEEVLADKFALYLRDSGNIKQPELKSFFQKLIEQIKKWITGINEVENLFKQITEGKTEKQGIIPKTSKQKLKFEKNTLEEEARKYKSAEEFVKAQDKPILHGTNKKFNDFDLSKRGMNEKDIPARNAFFFTDSIDTAKSYGKNVQERYGKFDKPITVDAEGKMYGDMRDEIYDATIKAKEEGNDVIIIKNLSDRKDWGNYEPATHYAVLDINKLKTKSQLTEIWNKANNKKTKYKFEEPPFLETIEDTREIPKEETSEQKRRSEVTRKLQAQMDAIQKELEKVQLEELKYTLPDEKFLGINDELEGQYQNFKEIMKLKSAKAISETEDVTQLKKDLIGRSLVTVISKVQRDDKIRKTPSGKPVFDKNGKMLVGNIIRDKDGKPVVTKTKIVKKITPEQIDNILYNQEESEEVIFEMFKDRILEERSNRGWKGKLADDRKQLSKKMARVEKAMKEEERRGEVFAKGQLAGFERGVKEGADQAHNLINKRRYMIRITRDFFNLTDNDIKNLAKKDLRYMTDAEFTKFLDDISVRAMELNARRELKSALLGHIEEYELKNTENLQKALKLPPIEKMTIEQLEQFHNAILPFEFGDEFLSVRKLETLDNTELAGMRTVREIRSNLLKKLNLDEDILDEDVAKVSFSDRFKYDTALAEKSPFYNLMVQEVLKSELLAEQVYLNVEERTQELTKKARESRRKIKGLPVAVKIGNALIPQDKLVFNWLSATADKKLELQAEMTKEEMDLALYVQAQYAKMRDMLIKKKTLERYRENYITHTQRSFVEAWKDSGITRALKEIIIQNRRQEAYFDIIDDTGQILPLEKFFQFSLRRIPEEEKKRMRAQGIEIGVDPTKNVAKAFLTYFRTFAKKSQLDSIIPMLDSYVFVLQDRARKTPRGIELDKGLKNFFNDWMNTKKGRVKKLYVLDQGTKLDTAVRAGNALVTLIDLGINIPVGLASNVGETAMNFVSLGTKKMALGVRRKYTKKGKAILKKYENFVGKGAFAELDEVSKDISDKLLEGVYLLFKIANVRANKTFLLGSMTKEEWESGEISPERLAQMKIDMGRYRAVSGSESIIGKTSLGKTFTKYKTWAVPALTTSSKNIKKMLVLIKNGKNPLATREFQELFRSTIPVLVLYSLFSASDDDDSYIGQILVKIRREILSSISALSPMMWLSIPRLLTLLSDLGTGVQQLILLEKYKDNARKGELKGLEKLKTTFTPQTLKQIKKATTKEDSGFNVELPDLPEMPELPDLPELPEL